MRTRTLEEEIIFLSFTVTLLIDNVSEDDPSSQDFQNKRYKLSAYYYTIPYTASKYF
nr:hypothetical protein LOCUS_630 [Candidatus Liberibacter asiaticus]